MDRLDGIREFKSHIHEHNQRLASVPVGQVTSHQSTSSSDSAHTRSTPTESRRIEDSVTTGGHESTAKAKTNSHEDRLYFEWVAIIGQLNNAAVM